MLFVVIALVLCLFPVPVETNDLYEIDYGYLADDEDSNYDPLDHDFDFDQPLIPLELSSDSEGSLSPDGDILELQFDLELEGQILFLDPVSEFEDSGMSDGAHEDSPHSLSAADSDGLLLTDWTDSDDGGLAPVLVPWWPDLLQ